MSTRTGRRTAAREEDVASSPKQSETVPADKVAKSRKKATELPSLPQSLELTPPKSSVADLEDLESEQPNKTAAAKKSAPVAPRGRKAPVVSKSTPEKKLNNQEALQVALANSNEEDESDTESSEDKSEGKRGKSSRGSNKKMANSNETQIQTASAVKAEEEASTATGRKQRGGGKAKEAFEPFEEKVNIIKDYYYIMK